MSRSSNIHWNQWTILLFLLLLPSAFHVSGKDADVIRQIEACQPPVDGKIVYAEDFSNQPSKRKLPPGYTFSSRKGKNGTGAVVYERNTPDEYASLYFPLPDLEANHNYTVEAELYADNIKTKGTIGGIYIEFRKNRKYAGGCYVHLHSNRYEPGKWITLQQTFICPPDVKAFLVFYMRKNTTGEIRLNRVIIRKTGSSHVFLLNKPYGMLLNTGKNELEFTGFNIPPHAKVLLTLESSDSRQNILMSGKENIYTGTAKLSSRGKVKAVLKAADLNNGKLLCRQEFSFQADSAQTPPLNSSLIDSDRRLIRNSQPFMPLGVYCYGHSSEEDLKTISDAGFNCIMDYRCFTPAGSKAPAGDIPAIRKMLDLYQKHHLKSIFSFRGQLAHRASVLHKSGNASNADDVTRQIVQGIKDHPALLAYYVSDEENLEHIPNIIHLREVISHTDPFHPTWTLTCNTRDLPYYGNSGDIIGVDPYPIGDASPKGKQSLARMQECMKAVQPIRQPFWCVNQAFSWGLYREIKQENAKKYKIPTLQELRTMPLLAAVYGARGFVFYSYSTIRYNKLIPGYFQSEWPKIKQVVKMLKRMEPYIMGTAPLKILGQTGEFEAALFTADNGKRAVVIVGIEENASGTIRLPEGEFQSIYNNTEIQKSEAAFQFQGIDSDILIEK